MANRSAAWIAASVVVASLFGGGAGCVTDEDADNNDEASGLPATDDLDGDGKADGELRVRVDGLTVWFDNTVLYVGGERPWRVEGRASRNLERVFSFVAPDQQFARADLASARKFEINMTGAEHAAMLEGVPLFVSIRPASGEYATASLWLAPRLLTATGGSPKVRLDSTVTPRWIDGQAVYRGGARTNDGYSLAANTLGAPTVTADTVANRWVLDFDYAGLAAGAVTPIGFAVTGASPGSKTANSSFYVRRLGLTRLDPNDVWQTTCRSAVRTCLAALAGTTTDASSCGRFDEVEACDGLPELSSAPDAARAANDLRNYLVSYYAAHGSDIVGSGGNTLAAAQAAVSAAGFSPVLDAEEDPYAHDLATTILFRHSDVTYPGSDIAWFVAYERTTGALLEVYDFN